MISDENLKHYVLCKCSELENKVLNTNNPLPRDSFLYFKFHEILNNNFGLGRDLSTHPKNPLFNKKCFGFEDIIKFKKLFTTMDNIQKLELVVHLQEKIEELKPKIFGESEPNNCDRLNFFAYSNYLFVKFGIGADLSKNVRNPWKDTIIPLDFSSYNLITPLPVFPLLQNQKDNSVSNEISQFLWKVYEIKNPEKTLYQGTEAVCLKFCQEKNQSVGNIQFACVSTRIQFIPRQKKNGVKVCQTIIKPTNVKKLSKEKNNFVFETKPDFNLAKSKRILVEEYLIRCAPLQLKEHND